MQASSAAEWAVTLADGSVAVITDEVSGVGLMKLTASGTSSTPAPSTPAPSTGAGHIARSLETPMILTIVLGLLYQLLQ